MHADRARIRADELVVTEDEVGATRYSICIVAVHGDLQTERLAVLGCVSGASGIRRDEQ